jgi:hypothetical protein
VHGVEDGFQCFAQRRQGVFDLRRDLPVDLAADDAVRLQLPELLGQRPVRHPGQGAVQLVEPPGPAQQLAQDQDLPQPADDGQRRFDRAADGLLAHGDSTVSRRILGYSNVHTCPFYHASEE